MKQANWIPAKVVSFTSYKKKQKQNKNKQKTKKNNEK